MSLFLECSKCNVIKINTMMLPYVHHPPINVHHCSQCKKCIVGMDHHCIFTNSCIGIGNMKFFLLFNYYCML
jgi:hypothetical protein